MKNGSAKLQQIYKLMAGIGDCLSALDPSLGNSNDPWRVIQSNSSLIRVLATGLPEELQVRLPVLMAYTRSGQLYWRWGSFCDEIEVVLQKPPK